MRVRTEIGPTRGSVGSGSVVPTMSSNIPYDLSRSNWFPESPEERKPLLDAIADDEQRITAGNNDVGPLETRIQVHRSLLSPIRRLPPEILSQIFEDAAYNYYSYIRLRHWTNPHNLPMFQFTTVSYLWRQVAISTPFLWNYLNMDLDAIDDRVVRIIDTMLQRSGNAPLRLYITCERWMMSVAPDYQPRRPQPERMKAIECATAVMRLLLAHSERWRTVTLSIPDYLVPIIAEANCQFPRLVGVTIEANSPRRFASSCTLDLFQNAISLVSASLNSCTPSVIGLPLQGLRQLYLSISSEVEDMAELHRVLTEATSLDLLSLTRGHGPKLYGLGDNIVHPRLNTFVCTQPHDLSFVDSLTLPSLVDLRLQQVDMSISLIKAWTVLIHRSRCTIQTLELGNISDTTPFASLFQSLPSLEVLRLLFAPLTEDAVQALSAQTADGRMELLPSLKNFHMQGRNHPSNLFDMLSPRWKGALETFERCRGRYHEARGKNWSGITVDGFVSMQISG